RGRPPLPGRLPGRIVPNDPRRGRPPPGPLDQTGRSHLLSRRATTRPGTRSGGERTEAVSARFAPVSHRPGRRIGPKRAPRSVPHGRGTSPSDSPQRRQRLARGAVIPHAIHLALSPLAARETIPEGNWTE